jgi:hypothetical protein
MVLTASGEMISIHEPPSLDDLPHPPNGEESMIERGELQTLLWLRQEVKDLPLQVRQLQEQLKNQNSLHETQILTRTLRRLQSLPLFKAWRAWCDLVSSAAAQRALQLSLEVVQLEERLVLGAAALSADFDDDDSSASEGGDDPQPSGWGSADEDETLSEALQKAAAMAALAKAQARESAAAVKIQAAARGRLTRRSISAQRPRKKVRFAEDVKGGVGAVESRWVSGNTSLPPLDSTTDAVPTLEGKEVQDAALDEAAKEVFDGYDMDGSGKISYAEMRQVCVVH